MLIGLPLRSDTLIDACAFVLRTTLFSKNKKNFLTYSKKCDSIIAMLGSVQPSSQFQLGTAMKGNKTMKLLSIYDKKTGFNPPVVQPNEGSAIRWFGELCGKDETPMHKYPKDFELKVIGEFDEYKGVYNLVEPNTIATAEQFVDVK